jgi:hypothetical protein
MYGFLDCEDPGHLQLVKAVLCCAPRSQYLDWFWLGLWFGLQGAALTPPKLVSGFSFFCDKFRVLFAPCQIWNLAISFRNKQFFSVFDQVQKKVLHTHNGQNEPVANRKEHTMRDGWWMNRNQSFIEFQFPG